MGRHFFEAVGGSNENWLDSITKPQQAYLAFSSLRKSYVEIFEVPLRSSVGADPILLIFMAFKDHPKKPVPCKIADFSSTTQ